MTEAEKLVGVLEELGLAPAVYSVREPPDVPEPERAAACTAVGLLSATFIFDGDGRLLGYLEGGTEGVSWEERRKPEPTLGCGCRTGCCPHSCNAHWTPDGERRAG